MAALGVLGTVKRVGGESTVASEVGRSTADAADTWSGDVRRRVHTAVSVVRIIRISGSSGDC